MVKCTIRVAKTKTQISFAVNAKLICVFVFAYADCWFSHEPAHILLLQDVSQAGKSPRFSKKSYHLMAPES